jgi:hypothetical protein
MFTPEVRARVTSWLCACIEDRADEMIVNAKSVGGLDEREVKVLGEALSSLAEDSDRAVEEAVRRASERVY